MTILEILNRLATIAPDVCKKIAYSDGPTFVIGSYSFWYDSLGNFQAYTSVVATGRPALAWLADAIMGECEKRGWYFDIAYLPKIKKYHTDIKPGFEPELQSNKCNGNAESLLAAFLAAIEGER